jgi:uncharacterized protein (TIGR03118 family)
MFGLIRRSPASRGARPEHRFRPTLVCLEDRCLLSGNVLQTNLVSDLPGVAAVTDPHLVNPWGISEGPATPFWVSDNNAGVATLYNVPGDHNTSVSINPLFVNIPAPGDLTGNSGTPTGTVFNIDQAGKGFMITDGTHTAPAFFLFATEDGTIVGWNPKVDPTGKFDGPNGVSTHAVIAVDNSTNPTAADGAVYKGLAIATDANGRTLLYAANFRAGTIDVFDTDFKPVTTLPAGAFTDPNLPAGYAPFDVQVLNRKVYVTYALQNADKHDDVAGPHHGFVDVFNLDGTGRQRLISRGPLDSPWGLAIAPTGFAGISAPNKDPVLLVGNFGNGRINAFDATTGEFLTQLKDPDGEPIQIDGLWALKVGNGKAGGDANTVYFTAGLFGETHGLFGSLATPKPGTDEGPAEQQMVTAALDVFQDNLNTLNIDLSSKAPPDKIKQDLQALNASLVQLVQAEVQFAADTRADLGGHGGGHGHDTDALDDLFADLGSLTHDLV